MFTGFSSMLHSTRLSFRTFFLAAFLGLAAALTFGSAADARIGGGGSFGSRGSRTYSMPSATPTAPRVSPFQRSATPNGGFTTPSVNPGFANGARGGIFGGGFGRGLLGGFLGAGLFGLLFGHGLTGGLGGGLSLLGLVLQLGLLFLAFRFFMGLMGNRRQTNYQGGNSMFGGAPFSGTGGYGQAGSGLNGAAPASRPISIGPDDYSAFEHRLAESQSAYSNGDLATLNRIATPEMAQNFAQELAENDRRGVVNKISDVHLLQGDLAEAWQENGTDYASVAMRFSLVDATVERNSGRVVAGDDRAPQQVTEVWTFRRPAGGAPQAWTLSGIQQA